MSIDDVSSKDKTQQSLITQNLRASHEIITRLEQAKASLERMMDRLPDLFVVCDRDGRILNGNAVAANLFNVNVERLLWQNLSRLFCRETWNIFKTHLVTMEKTADKGLALDFELQVDGEVAEERAYHWNIQLLGEISDRRGPLFSAFGRDITQIRAYEKQLSQIFSAIPLGIITIDSKGKIVGPYSQYTEFLLGTTNLSEKSIKYELFEPSLPYMSKPEQLGARELFTVFGNDELWFDLGKDRFPKEFFFPNAQGSEENENNGRWLGLTYHPIVINEIVHRILIVIEDRTEIVLARQREAAARYQENKMIERILDIQRCDANTLKSSFEDLESYFSKLEQSWEENKLRLVLNNLHGIKGVARAGGFRNLKRISHDAEEKLLPFADDGLEPDKELAVKIRKELVEEWKELADLLGLLHGQKSRGKGSHEYLKEKLLVRRDSLSGHVERLQELCGSKLGAEAQTIFKAMTETIRELPLVPIRSVEDRLKTRSKITADQCKKKVKVEFDWADVSLEERQILQLADILGHLLTNAIDHGVEIEEIRRAAGKPETGHIRLSSRVKGDELVFEFCDDGTGIDIDRVKLKAIKTELATAESLAKMSEEEIMQLIFTPGFSTRSEVTEISGRGIGLDSVAQTVKEMGGRNIRVVKQAPHGCRFDFSIKLG